MASNIAYIYQPHYMTSKFRVACKEQLGQEVNYIVVTCSPSYNGVWKWNAKDKDLVEKWNNGKLPCYCVPINICEKVKNLDELTNKDVIAMVESQQRKWKAKEVKNQ